MIIAKKKISIGSIMPIPFFMMIVFSRGMILGNIALKISFICGLTCILWGTLRLSTSYKNLQLFIICIVFFSYCFFNGLILNDSSNYPTIIENMVYWIVNVVAALLILKTKKIEISVGKIIVKVLAFFVVSYLITFILSMLVGLQQLHLFTIDYDYFYDSPVYFPFTIVYGVGKIGSFEVFRMQGFGRESGITQTLYIWAFYRCANYVENVKLYKFLLAVGIIVCFSTTGILIFAITLAVDILSKKERYKNRFLMVTLLVILGMILAYGGAYSISNRLVVSYSDRLENINYSFKLLERYPLFGIGYVKSLWPGDTDQSDICFLSSAGKIGIVGVVLFALIYVVSVCRVSEKKSFILSNMGLLLTALLAQPLFKYPLIYVMLFMNYDKSREYVKAYSRKIHFSRNSIGKVLLGVKTKN